MSNMAEKIFGWFLIVAGVAIIVWGLFASYHIFTGVTEVPQFFEMPTAQVPVTCQTPATPAELQGEMGKMIGEQLKTFLPINAVPQTLNLFIWSILVGILIFGGSQISGIGIKLIKK